MAAAKKPVFEELTGRARGRLLGALRAGPDSGVHVRELARGAQLSLSSLQRELGRFSSLGVLKTGTRGNRVTHRLRREDPFVRLLLAAATALELRGRRFAAMPADRKTERVLAELCAHLPPESGLWREFGEPEFLSGIAVALAGHTGFSRPAYLALAEALSSGAATPQRHEKWYRRNRPDLPRFFSMIDRERRTHARIEDQ